MQDRNGSEIRTGEIVKIVGQHDVSIHNYWIIMGFLDHGVAIEAILQQYDSKEINFVNIRDIERPFGA